jgi:UDP-N-acetylglucosamine--N-acetylmuramyl-(pentapeptide) pyrophosphoryl-undecaprenol N-acetylglucosamine transferase
MRLVIAGGGTGGHVSPGLGVAQELKKRAPDSRVLWVGTAGSIEADMVGRAGLPFAAITAAGLKRRLALANLLLPWKVLQGFWDSLAVLRGERPEAVLVTGGFVSLPLGLAAWWQGIPLVLHEANAVPGLANLVLGFLARRVCLSFPREGLDSRQRLTGNPVRMGAGRPISKAQARRAFGLAADKKTVLIFPGSRAAHQVNLAVEGALEQESSARPNYQVLWMCGKQDFERASAVARRAKLKVAVRDFIHEAPKAYAAADLVVARAGASTLAELTALGLPALLVPYPFATGRHQDANAAVLEAAGAARVVADRDLDGERLAKEVEGLLSDPVGLKRMAAASKGLGQPQAAAKVLKAIEEALSC